MIGAAEVAYTLEGVALDLREDGRSRLDFRHVSLEVSVLPQAKDRDVLELQHLRTLRRRARHRWRRTAKRVW